MLIEQKDLKVGDEIIITSGSRLKYLKIIRPGRDKNKLSRYRNIPLFTNAKCTARREEKTYVYQVSANAGNTYTVKRKEYQCTAEDHNIEIYQNLNGKTIWLVKRERI